MVSINEYGNSAGSLVSLDLPGMLRLYVMGISAKCPPSFAFSLIHVPFMLV